MADTPKLIESALLKAFYLAGNSAIFPQLIEAACWKIGVAYSHAVVQWCASQEMIIDNVQVPDINIEAAPEGGVDWWLLSALKGGITGITYADVDAAIEAVVQAYKDAH